LDTRTISTGTHGRYLVGIPEHSRGTLVGFHGYQENAAITFEVLKQIAADRSIGVVSIQGLHRFYTRNNDVIASWMTKEDRELAIADNVAYVAAVVQAVAAAQPFERLVFLGFSQGASMASRAAAHAGERCHGLIMLGGDVAPEVLASGARLPRTILGRGTIDAFYSPEQFTADSEALEERGALAAAVEFRGGHEFTPTFRAAAGALIQAL